MQRSDTGISSALFSIVVLVALTLPLYLFFDYTLDLYVNNSLEFLTFGSWFVGEGAFFAYSVIFGFLSVAFIVFVIFLLLSQRMRATRMANRMLEETQASQDLLFELYQSSPIPYLMISHKGIIQLPNKAALRLLGVHSEELEDTELVRVVDAEMHNRFSVLFSRFQDGSSVHEEEIQIVRKNGSKRWVILSLFPLRGKEKKHNGVAALVDITERKEVDQAKTEFVSLASHQLRTPLSAIKWYTELLVSGDVGKLEPKQQEYAEKVHNSNERMIDLVNTLLNVSRLEMGTLTVEARKIDLVSMIEDVFEEHAGQINIKRIRLNREYGKGIPTILSDPKLIRMVIQNLISNAVKYTLEKGAIRVALSAQGSEVHILVSDDGLGVPEEAKQKLFTKLYRASNAKDKVSEGTGLGLYIVREVLRKLGGSISFTSEENKGTTFIAKVPVTSSSSHRGRE